MRGDIPEAAFRLLNQLPVRTHERTEEARFLREAKGPKGQRIEYRGKVYESKTHVLVALRIGHRTLMALIKSGEARIL